MRLKSDCGQKCAIPNSLIAVVFRSMAHHTNITTGDSIRLIKRCNIKPESILKIFYSAILEKGESHLAISFFSCALDYSLKSKIPDETLDLFVDRRFPVKYRLLSLGVIQRCKRMIKSA